MLIVCKIITHLCSVIPQDLHLAHHLIIYLYSVPSNNNPSCIIFFFCLIVPRTFPNLGYCESSLRIHVQNPLQNLLRPIREIFWKVQVSSQYFFVKFIRIFILKREISTEHCEEYDATRPYIHP